MEQRLQKIIAEMGIASRRKAEEIIMEGRVTVNGKVAEIGMKADPLRDHIKVDGKLLTKPEKKVYYIFNKPRGVVTSMGDPQGRPAVNEYLRGIKQRVFPIGRLDFDSEGLLLLTNDGDFAYAIEMTEVEKSRDGAFSASCGCVSAATPWFGCSVPASEAVVLRSRMANSLFSSVTSTSSSFGTAQC